MKKGNKFFASLSALTRENPTFFVVGETIVLTIVLAVITKHSRPWEFFFILSFFLVFGVNYLTLSERSPAVRFRKFLSGMKKKIIEWFEPSEEEKRAEIIREKTDPLEIVKRETLEERDVLMREINITGIEIAELRKFKKIAEDLDKDTKYIEKKLEAALEKHQNNLNGYHFFAALGERIDERIRKIRKSPEKFLKETETQYLD